MKYFKVFYNGEHIMTLTASSETHAIKRTMETYRDKGFREMGRNTKENQERYTAVRSLDPTRPSPPSTYKSYSQSNIIKTVDKLLIEQNLKSGFYESDIHAMDASDLLPAGSTIKSNKDNKSLPSLFLR